MNDKYFKDFAEFDFKNFSNWLFCMNAYEFSLIATTLGFIISPTLTLNEQNSLGNFFELLGQVILTINAQAVTVRQKNNKYSNIKVSDIVDIKQEINDIKNELIKLRQDTLNNDKA